MESKESLIAVDRRAELEAQVRRTIAAGATLAAVCSTGLETSLGPGMKALIAGAVFPVGLVAIVITGMALFTSDTMLIPVAVFQGKTTWKKAGWA